MRKIKNYCSFTIKGLNQESFFSALSKSFFVYDLERFERNKARFKVKLKDAKKVKKQILSSSFEILSQEKRGFLNSFFSLRKAYGIIVGLIIAVVGFFCQLPFVWRVQINGLDVDTKQAVEKFINENIGKNKNNLDCKQVELCLQEKFDTLSFVSVSIVGQTLVVNAKEGEEPIEKNGQFSPIVAECDGRVVKMQLLQGTLAVRVGDVVQSGDVIVEPFIVDSYGEQKLVEPKAIFVFETWIKGEATHNTIEYEFRRTGNSYISSSLSLFGLEIYSHNSELCFDNYEVELTSRPFSKNNILPFIYTRKTYYELEQVLLKTTYEERRDEKIEMARKKALQNILDCDIIKEEKYVENECGDTTFVTYYLIVEREIICK